LTTEQRSQLRAIEFEAMAHHFSNGPRRGPPDANDDRVKSAMRDMLVVLNPDQRVQWQSMIGNPYEGPMPLHRGGPPGFSGRHEPPGPPGPPGRKDSPGRREGGRRESADRPPD
jgi:hypothetical protein